MKVVMVIAMSFLLTVLAAASANQGASAQSCAPEVSEWLPRGSATTAKPRISATIRSLCGIRIEVDSVRMAINDEPVKPKVDGNGATLTVTYVPESALVEEADHTVALRARDVKGATVEKTWTFHLGDTYSR